jgi:hypothetical protein
VDSIPIFLFIIQHLGIEYLELERDSAKFLVFLPQKISAGRREIDEIEIRKTTDKKN